LLLHLRFDRGNRGASRIECCCVSDDHWRPVVARRNSARREDLSRLYGQEGSAQRGDSRVDRFLSAASKRDHGDHSSHADHDAEHRQKRAKLVRPERSERYANRFSEQHVATSLIARRPSSAASTAPTTSGSASRTRSASGRRRRLESTTRAGSDASLKLVALCLQYRGSEQGDLFALLNAAEDLAVIEIADAESHHARRVFIAQFHEYEHRSAGAAGPASRSSLTTTARETTRSATTTAASAGRRSRTGRATLSPDRARR